MWEPPSMNGDMEDFDLGSGNNNAVSNYNYINIQCILFKYICLCW